jgi:hypothetical protein
VISWGHVDVEVELKEKVMKLDAANVVGIKSLHDQCGIIIDSL